MSSLRAIKQTLQAAHRTGIETAREIEDRLMLELAGPLENIEAVRTFIEKRAPDFSRFRSEKQPGEEPQP